MSSYSNDRQIIERLVIPALMSAVASIMMRQADEESLKPLQEVCKLLTEAMNEAVSDIDRSRVEKIIRRAKRLSVDVLKPHFDHHPATIYLIVAYWTMDLANQDVIQIGADSAFSRAWDMMAEIMGVVADEREELGRSAVEGATQLSAAFRQQGYFPETRDSAAA